LKEKSISLLASKTLVDMKTAGATLLYTIPTGKSCIVTHIVVHNQTASLAGGTSYSFGTNSATYDNWDSARTLAALTVTTTAQMLTPNLPADSADQVTTVALTGTEFKMVVTTGSALAATATIDVFGYLY